jgi:hypothetical protein
MIDCPDAYRYVVLAVMLAEINHCVARLELQDFTAIDKGDIAGCFVPDPRLAGFAGRIDTKEYTFSFGLSGHLQFIVKLRQRGGLSLGAYQEKLSRMKWTMTTNSALNVARHALEAIEVDGERLNKEHGVVCEERSFYTRRNGERQLVPLPIFDIKWGGSTIPVVDVVVSGISGSVLSIRQEDGSYSRRPKELIRNMDKLLAIPDSEFLKYTPEQRSNLVAEFAAVQYPPLSNQTENANHAATNSPAQEKPMLNPQK